MILPAGRLKRGETGYYTPASICIFATQIRFIQMDANINSSWIHMEMLPADAIKFFKSRQDVRSGTELTWKTKLNIYKTELINAVFHI